MNKCLKQEKPTQQEKQKRGRPSSRVVNLDDTPRNVAKALFGIKSDKFSKTQQDH